MQQHQAHGKEVIMIKIKTVEPSRCHSCGKDGSIEISIKDNDGMHASTNVYICRACAVGLSKSLLGFLVYPDKLRKVKKDDRD